LAHAKWVHDGCKSDTYNLKDIVKSQDMFLRTDVSTEEEMKVSGISRLWVRNGKLVETETKASVGLWQVGSDYKEWATKVGSILEDKRTTLGVDTLSRTDVTDIYWGHREYVADDPMIIKRALAISERLGPQETGVIFTQDTCLVRKTANRTGMTFVRVSPSVLLELISPEDARRKCMEFDMNPQLARAMLKNMPGNPVSISLVDTGSLDAMLMTHVQDINTAAKSGYSKRTLINYGTDDRGRFEVYSLKAIPSSKLAGVYSNKARDNLGRPAFETFRPQKTLRTKVPKFEAYRSYGSSAKSNLSGYTERELEDFRRPAPPSEII
jgi:hypothetical protein